MTKATKRSGTDARYKAFLYQVNLFALGLDSLDADLERDAYALAHADSANGVTRTIESSFELTEFSSSQFAVRANFALRVECEWGRSNEIPLAPHSEAERPMTDEILKVRAAFSAQFNCDKSRAGKNYAERFAQSEARLIFWPYFRQTVSDVTARMSIRPIVVPISLK